MFFQRQQSFFLQRIFVFLFDCNDSLRQPLIADKMLFSFSYHSFDGRLNRPVLLKNPGEKRDIFCKNCFLECNAGSGYHDRTLLIRGTSFCKEGIFSHQNTGHQIGIRLADTDTRITQCYVSSQQVIQHFVA